VPLVAPNLDDRTFDDLVKEARTRIARYSPAWTDFNDSDPGITLVQLFAWLTEMLMYRLNKVPDLNYVKFLQLLGLSPYPAQPATAYLTFTPDPKIPPRSIAVGTQVSAPSAAGGDPVVFETEDALDLVRPALAELQVYDGNDYQLVSNQNDPASPDYYPLGWVPQPGNALYLGFEQLPPPTSTTAPASAKTPPAPFPQSIRMRVFLDAAAMAGQPQLSDGSQDTATSPVSIMWEYKPDATRSWRRLALDSDGSLAFTRDGDIVIEGPQDIQPTGQGKRVVDPTAGKPVDRYWIRARLDSGTYPSGKEPVISFLRINTVPARNVSTVQNESLGFSDGSPSQVFTLKHIPVLPEETFTLELAPQTGDPVVWTQVPDFLASGPDDQHYLLDPATGAVTFGDGARGLVPTVGDEVIVTQYRYGGGSAGNAPASTITTPVTDIGNVQVTNERPAVGGRDEQDVEDLKQQAPAFLRSRSRAVTSDDFAAIAAQAGGVARAASVPLAHPSYPGMEIPGVVSVVIVPENDDPNPEPSADQVAATCRYLNPFRLITTEVYVRGPIYRKVSVQAQVTAQPQLAASAVSQAVEDAVNTELDPLGRTWVNGVATRGTTTTATVDPLQNKQNQEFGRNLYPSRLYGVILKVAGVIAVEQLLVQVDGRYVDLGQPVPVPAVGLVYGADHEITVDLAT
jgi:predicted phage baseplate assembly protein